MLSLENEAKEIRLILEARHFNKRLKRRVNVSSLNKDQLHRLHRPDRTAQTS